MGWKTFPYWLNGGIISVILLGFIAILSFVIPTFYTFFYASVFHGDYFTNPHGIIFSFFLSIVYFLITGFFVPANKNMPVLIDIIIVLLTAVYYFAIGALVGWIVGKIKSKK
ncbi:MAG: hypothetical protein AABW75_00805 [Nanoarchaeota archaeon]